MNVHEDSVRLEILLPEALSVLFHTTREDPLRHHPISQVRLMRSLLEGSKRASELSHNLGLSPSSLTQMTGRMIAAGLVSKESGAADRRVRRFSLTPSGRALMEDRQAMRAKAAAKVLERMNEDRRAHLIELLEEVTSLGAEENLYLREALV